ncbi:MAG: outer membrane beta-barrel protein [Marinifilaceae bacterium]
MKNNIVDHKFKQAMDSATATPPPNAWGNIAKASALKKQRRIFMRNCMRYAAIAILLLTIGVSLWQFEKSAIPTTFEYNTPVLAYRENIVCDMSTPPVLISGTYRPKQTRRIESFDPLTTTTLSGEQLNAIAPQATFIGLKKQDITPLTDGENIKIYEQYRAMINPNLKKNTYQPEHTVRKSVPTPVKYSLSCVVAPGFNQSQYNSSIPNTRGAAYTESDMKGGFNLGGGVNVVMQTGKRFSFQTGVLYSKIVHSTVETNIYYPRAEAVTLSAITNTVHSALGKIKNQTEAVVFQSDQIVPTSYTRSQTNNAIEQEFASIDIPLYVRYKLVDYKLGVHLMGGFSGSILVGNNAYLNYDNSREKMGKTEDIRPFNLSANLGVTFEYPILKNLHFIAEPGFRYYLQSFSQDNQILFRPYQFSFSTGLGVTF